jgi:hypothetical protein
MRVMLKVPVLPTAARTDAVVVVPGSVDETGISTHLNEPFCGLTEVCPSVPGRTVRYRTQRLRDRSLLGTHIKAVVFFKSLLEMRKKPRLGGNFFEYVSRPPCYLDGGRIKLRVVR